MPAQVIGKVTQRTRHALQLIQRFAHPLALRRVLGNGRIGRAQGLVHFFQRHLHIRQCLAIELLEAGTQFAQAAVQVAGNAFQRQLGNALHHSLQLLLQLLQATWQRRDGDRVGGLVEGHLGGIRVEVQGNEHLPGDQVAATRLGPQPMFDEGADQPPRAVHVAFAVLEHGQHLAVHRP
ncbi:hypothetical protein D3C77_492060 [compost metagenome]